MAPQVGKFMGVRNGIDIDIWDPETDAFLPIQYGPDAVVEGKAAAREELRRRLGLTGWGDKPLVGVVSRLTAQKGMTRRRRFLIAFSNGERLALDRLRSNAPARQLVGNHRMRRGYCSPIRLRAEWPPFEDALQGVRLKLTCQGSVSRLLRPVATKPTTVQRSPESCKQPPPRTSITAVRLFRPQLTGPIPHY